VNEVVCSTLRNQKKENLKHLLTSFSWWVTLDLLLVYLDLEEINA